MALRSSRAHRGLLGKCHGAISLCHCALQSPVEPPATLSPVDLLLTLPMLVSQVWKAGWQLLEALLHGVAVVAPGGHSLCHLPMLVPLGLVTTTAKGFQVLADLSVEI